jgi:hypothetical protein
MISISQAQMINAKEAQEDQDRAVSNALRKAESKRADEDRAAERAAMRLQQEK